MAVDEFVPLDKRTVTMSLVCVALSMFLTALSQTIIATVLPQIVAEFGGFEKYTWAVTSYMIAATVAYPIVGRLSDYYGRRFFMIVGMAIFMAGSVLVGLSASMTHVVAFRIVQGIGGGITMTCCYVSVADLFPPKERGKYHGLFGAVYAVASVAGPVLGGFIADRYAWHWAFIAIAIVGIPILALTVRVYPTHRGASGNQRLDYPGMVAIVFAIVPVLCALSVGGSHYEWDAFPVIGLLLFGLTMTAAFVVIESRAAWPIMPLQIYSNRMIRIAVIVTFLTSLGLYGIVIFLPLFFQVVAGLSATDSGKLLVPLLLGMVVGGIVSGQSLSRIGEHYRIQALIGSGIMSLGIFLLTTIDEKTGVLGSGVYIVTAGFGFGWVVATFSVAVQNLVPFALVGAATSALQFFRSAGGMLGLAVLGTVMARNFSSDFYDSLPACVKEALPRELIDEIKDNPNVLADADGIASVESRIPDSGSECSNLRENLFDSAATTLAGALKDVFTIVAILVAVAFVIVAIFPVSFRSAAANGDDGDSSESNFQEH
ncbi:MAG: MDR family MFS transporter [Albidovulum sp.]|nr:MDR family MFS transporter [Albidovulum sp.]MDE0531234.1 MDR family MFS transporter [Albidovulum sp.]